MSASQLDVSLDVEVVGDRVFFLLPVILLRLFRSPHANLVQARTRSSVDFLREHARTRSVRVTLTRLQDMELFHTVPVIPGVPARGILFGRGYSKYARSAELEHDVFL